MYKLFQEGHICLLEPMDWGGGGDKLTPGKKSFFQQLNFF